MHDGCTLCTVICRNHEDITPDEGDMQTKIKNVLSRLGSVSISDKRQSLAMPNGSSSVASRTRSQTHAVKEDNRTKERRLKMQQVRAATAERVSKRNREMEIAEK